MCEKISGFHCSYCLNVLRLIGWVSESNNLTSCLLPLNVEELDVFSLCHYFHVIINHPELIISNRFKICRLALKPWPLQNRASRWLRQNIHLALAGILTLVVEGPGLLHYIRLTLGRLLIIVVDRVDCSRILLSHGVTHVCGPVWVQADIVFLDACFHLSLNVFFMPLYKFLPDLFTVSQMPIFLELFNSFFFNDPLENLLASALITDEGFLLYELLNSICWGLIYPVSIP